MAARRNAKVTAVVHTCPRAHVDEDLLREARKKAFLLLLAMDGLIRAGGTYVFETFTEAEALRVLVDQLATDLATLGQQADPAEAREE